MSADGTLIERIDAALEGTTPGPWRQRADTPWGSKVLVNKSGEMYLGVNAYTSPPSDGWSSEARERAKRLGASKCADANLIAQAPSLLAESREEIARLREALDTIRRFVKVNAAWPATTNAWVEDYTARALAGTESPTQHGDEQ